MAVERCNHSNVGGCILLQPCPDEVRDPGRFLRRRGESFAFRARAGECRVVAGGWVDAAVEIIEGLAAQQTERPREDFVAGAVVDRQTPRTTTCVDPEGAEGDF